MANTFQSTSGVFIHRRLPVGPSQPGLRTVYVCSPRVHSGIPATTHAFNSPGLRWLHLVAASSSAQPGVPDPGRAAANQPPAATAWGPQDNGTPPEAKSVTSTSHKEGSPHMVQVSARASFRNVVKLAYLGEMLFVGIGTLICMAVAQWTVGTPLKRSNPYTFHVTLPEAPGVDLGTPVRMKGVPIGSVLSATPQLHRVSVEVEVNEAKTIIPRSAKFELTQSGLIPSASIDISPPEGVSAEALAAAAAAATAKRGSSRAADGGAATTESSSGTARSRRAATKVRLASPKDVAACKLQGVLVCQGDQLDGIQGGSMDELMGHMLKTLRKGEEEAAGPGAGIVPGRGPVQG